MDPLPTKAQHGDALIDPGGNINSEHSLIPHQFSESQFT